MQSWCISEMSSFSHYLADLMFRFCAEQWHSAYTPAVHMWATPRPVFDTDLSSLIGSQSPPLRGQFKGEGEACRAQIYAWCPGSRSSRSFCLPDHVQDLHHLLIDDEYYGHIQAHSAQPGNCPFIETTDEQRGETGEYENNSDKEKPCMQ